MGVRTIDPVSTEPTATPARRWLFLACAIALEVTGSLSLKGALEAPVLYLVVVVGYLGSFVFLAGTLRAGLPLGVAYGIWGAVGVALTAVLSAWIFGEPLTGLMALGIAVIIAGVLCVELGSQRAAAPGRAAEPQRSAESGPTREGRS